MKSSTKEKYHESDTFTEEQLREIAILINCNVPYKVLVKGYGTSYSNISHISIKRKRFLPESEIVKTTEQKFIFAQNAYMDESLSDHAKEYIKIYAFEPVAKGIADRFKYSPIMNFLESVYGIKFEPTDDYINMLKGFAIDVLSLHSRGRLYASIDNAVDHLTSFVSELEEAALTPEQRAIREDLDAKVHEVLDNLRSIQKENVESRFGLEDWYVHTPGEVSEIFW